MPAGGICGGLGEYGQVSWLLEKEGPTCSSHSVPIERDREEALGAGDGEGKGILVEAASLPRLLPPGSGQTSQSGGASSLQQGLQR